MTVWQRFVLAMVCSLMAGVFGGLLAKYLHEDFGVDRTEAFFIAGSTGYAATALLRVFVDYMRQR